jgi:predicted permease
MLPTFLAALGVVFTTLLFAVPGFLLVKSKLVKEGSISAFARLLMYIASPCLLFDSITRNEFSWELLLMLLLAFAFAVIMLLVGLLVFKLAFKKKSDDVKYRIFILATTLPNCAFMGVPVLEALLPDYNYAVAFSAMFSLAMNIISWSFGTYIISRDRKNISAKRIFFNPATVALVLALPFFFSNASLPSPIENAVILLAKMTTPLCMLIMGMRLACVSLKGVFLTPQNYLIIAIKQILFPLAVFFILLLLPLDSGMKSSIYIITACPVASVVLSHAEMIGNGQKNAAYLVLLGTFLSIFTIPVMSLLLKFF